MHLCCYVWLFYLFANCRYNHSPVNWNDAFKGGHYLFLNSRWSNGTNKDNNEDNNKDNNDNKNNNGNCSNDSYMEVYSIDSHL